MGGISQMSVRGWGERCGGVIDNIPWIIYHKQLMIDDGARVQVRLGKSSILVPTISRSL